MDCRNAGTVRFERIVGEGTLRSPVVPERSESGQRLCTDVDVEQLRLLRWATEAGRPISRVARLELEQPTSLVEEDDGARRRAERSRLTVLEGAAAAAEGTAELFALSLL